MNKLTILLIMLLFIGVSAATGPLAIDKKANVCENMRVQMTCKDVYNCTTTEECLAKDPINCTAPENFIGQIKKECSDKPYYAFQVDLKKGWNLVSLPISPEDDFAKIFETDCAQKPMWLWNWLEKKYVSLETYGWLLKNGGKPFGFSVWIKADSACSVKAKGLKKVNYDTSSTITTTTEGSWIPLPSAYESMTWEQVQGNCITMSGPHSYNNELNKWELAKTIEPGVGYLVKLKGITPDLESGALNCSLGNISETAEPPAFPE